MVLISDPTWYLQNQNTPFKLYSNAVFLVVALALRVTQPVLAAAFFALFVGSSAFHWRTSKETLALDRLTMVLVFSAFFHIFEPRIPMWLFVLTGWATVLIWYRTGELAYFFAFQALGGVLFLTSYGMEIQYKLLVLAVYVVVTASQLWREGALHAWKHILLAGLALLLARPRLSSD
jgi:hypothetical protein